MFDAYLSDVEQMAAAVRRTAQAPTAHVPTGKRPLAPAASGAEINAFFTKGR